MQVVPERAVAGHRGGFAEYDLADIHRDVGVAVDVLRELRHFAAEGSLVVRPSAVAVELDVREVAAVSFDGPHRFERRRPVAGDAELIAVDVRGVRQLQFIGGAGDLPDDGPWAGVETRHGVIEVGERVAALLPNFDAAGVHDLQRVAARRVQQPRAEGPQPRRFPGRDLTHGVVVVPHQHEEAFVDGGRVVEFFERVPRTEGGDGRVEDGRIAEARVEVACDESRRRAAAGAGAEQGGAVVRRGIAAVFGPEFAGDIHLGPGDMRVHIDAAGHDDESAQVERAIRRRAGVGDDFAVARPEVAHGAIDPAAGIVHGSGGEADE